jgi:hypothetical protein
MFLAKKYFREHAYISLTSHMPQSFMAYAYIVMAQSKGSVMARGGKRPRSGRKPVHGKRKLANFSTRITPELREALEREAKGNGHSLSQEVEQRLTDSLQAPKRVKEIWGEDRNLGLAHLINRTAQMIEDHTGGSWIHNDYTFRALRAAVEELFRILDVESSVPRNPDIPARLAQTIQSLETQNGYVDTQTPEKSGRYFANGVWWHVMCLDMPPVNRPTNDAFAVLANMRRLLGIRATPGNAISKEL